MGNLSFERKEEDGNRLTGWLSLSTDTFKSGHAQLSFLPEFRSGAFVIPGRVEDASPESRGYGARFRVRASKSAVADLDNGYLPNSGEPELAARAPE
jgi:hypothetical protein